MNFQLVKADSTRYYCKYYPARFKDVFETDDGAIVSFIFNEKEIRMDLTYDDVTFLKSVFNQIRRREKVVVMQED